MSDERSTMAGFPAPEPEATPAPPSLSAPALVGLVLSLLWLGGIGSLLGVTFGVIGLTETELPTKKGRPLAQAGIGLGIAGLALTLMVPVAVAAGRHRDAPRKEVPQACVTERADLDKAIKTWFGAGAGGPRSMTQLVEAGLLTEEPRYYALQPTGDTTPPTLRLSPAGRIAGCVLAAAPAGPGRTSTEPGATTLQPTTTAPATTVLGPTKGAQVAACADELRSLRTAEEAYQALNGTYGTATQLIEAGFLSEAPTWHDPYPLDDSHIEYRLTPAGEQVHCAG